MPASGSLLTPAFVGLVSIITHIKGPGTPCALVRIDPSSQFQKAEGDAEKHKTKVRLLQIQQLLYMLQKLE